MKQFFKNVLAVFAAFSMLIGLIAISITGLTISLIFVVITKILELAATATRVISVKCLHAIEGSAKKAEELLHKIQEKLKPQ